MKQNTRFDLKNINIDIDTFPLGCIVWDTELNIVSWNSAAEKIFGFSKSEAEDNNALSLIIPGDVVGDIRQIINEMRSGTLNVNKTIENLTKTGNRINCEWINTPLENEEGEVYGFLSIIQDITEQFQMNTELGKKVRELNNKSRYEEALTNILQLLGESNDLRTVLENAVDAMKRNIPRADNVSIYMVYDKYAVLQASRGYPQWFIKKVTKIPYPRGFTWKTITEGKSSYVVDVDGDDAIGPAGREVGTKSYVSLPLFHKESVVGVVNINSYSSEAFSRDEIDFLERMKIHIETAINNAKQVDALRKSEEKFSSFMNNLPGLAFIKDSEYRYVYVNSTFCDVFGFEYGDIIGAKTQDIWSDKLSEKFSATDMKVLETGREIQFVEETEYKGASLSWLVNKFPIYNGEDHPLYIAGIATDISELRRSQEKLKQQAELLDLAEDAIITFDRNKYITFCNMSAERLFNLSGREFSGMTLDQIFSGDVHNLESAFYTVLENGVWRGELVLTSDDGSEITVMSTWNLVNERVRGETIIFAVFSDITEKKQMEKQLYHSQRMESIGILAGGLAHDLNNIFQPIVMSADLMREALENNGEVRKQWLDIIDKSVQRATGLVNHVQSFSRGEGGEFKVFDVKQMITDLVNIIGETFPKSIDIQTDIPGENIYLSGNPVQIHQVLMNLCINSRDAMPEGGVLNLSLKKEFVQSPGTLKNPDAEEGEYVVIRVHDSGTGISPADIDMIFDPFFTTKELGKGTGLGLSTVYRIVQNHMGFIDVSSEVGSGTTFEVYLPLDELAGYTPVEERSVHRDYENGKGEHILVIDDEEAILDISKSILENGGYVVIKSSTGQDAVEYFTQHQDRVDLVIIDVMLPDMNAREVLQLITAMKPEINIIITSGLKKEAEQLADECSDSAITVLPKPYPAEELLYTVSTVLKGNKI